MPPFAAAGGFRRLLIIEVQIAFQARGLVERKWLLQKGLAVFRSVSAVVAEQNRLHKMHRVSAFIFGDIKC